MQLHDTQEATIAYRIDVMKDEILMDGLQFFALEVISKEIMKSLSKNY